MSPLRGVGGDGAWCRCNRKGSSNVAQQNPHKDQVGARQEPREKDCKSWDLSLGLDPQRDQAGGCPRPTDTAQGDNDRHYYEGDGLAMASVDTQAIEGEVDRIRSLGLEDLRREWRRLYHSEPPRISRDLLVLALGYRLQEIAHGGLGKSTLSQLQINAQA